MGEVGTFPWKREAGARHADVWKEAPDLVWVTLEAQGQQEVMG